MDVHHMDTEQYLTSVCQIIAQGRRVSVPVRGESMRPFLADGRDSVLLGPVNRKLRKGDIVLYQRSTGQHVLHRIISIDRNKPLRGGFYMRGDAQSISEGPIDPEQIRAVVLQVRRKGKWIGTADPCMLFYSCLWYRRWFPRRWAAAVYRRLRREKKQVNERM